MKITQKEKDRLLHDLSIDIFVTLEMKIEQMVNCEKSINQFSDDVNILHNVYSQVNNILNMMKVEEEPIKDQIIDSKTIGTGKFTMSSSIHNLALSNRLINCLMNDNINNIGELLNKTEYEILTIHLLGKKSLRELKEFLSNYGLKLREELIDG